MIAKRSIFLLVFANSIAASAPTAASESNCTQNRVDGTTIPVTRSMIYPAETVRPFYQWENDNGYCGEVSMMQAGLNNGQWMSQFNARLICGAGLSQSGPGPNDSWCDGHKNVPNYNAQLLLENPNDPSVSGSNLFASAATCLANSQLSATTYPYAKGFQTGNSGLSGYWDYMSWVKSEVIAGHQVTIGVLVQGGSDPQYDHEVTILAIGTNHGVADPTYFDDDVLFFDDHGAYTLFGDHLDKGWPPIPYGAGSDDKGCTPYVFGYSFGSLPRTRDGANADAAQAYSIIIPGVSPSYTSTGADGYLGTVAITGHNYAFSVSGATDHSTGGRRLLPIRITIPSATYTNSVANPKDPIAHWHYENSMIGKSNDGLSCTNTPPKYAMYPVQLHLTIEGLSPGVLYNLYEYDPPSPAAVASVAPSGNFNYSYYTLHMGSQTQFTASGPTFTKTVTKSSDQIVIYRAVPATAP